VFRAVQPRGPTSSTMPPRSVTTVIWDFDGTLADTLSANLTITRRIVERLVGRPAEAIPALSTLDRYHMALHSAENWRELYVRELGIPAARTEEAAALWTEFHHQDSSTAALFEGVREVVEELDGRRQGIVSQNSRANIFRSLAPTGLLATFDVIVADEDLPFHRQKPAPDGLLECASRLHAEPQAPADTVLYIGDHPVDIECVRRATLELERHERPWRVLSVGVEYGVTAERRWRSVPDFIASHPEDILALVADLEG
jgi:HAD superfamily hydrolase (TIGR01549 family)